MLTALLSSTGCALNPATGERELSLISEAEEVELGRQAARQVEATLTFVDDPELQAYVQTVGSTIAKNSQRPSLPWQFRVVDDPTPNAFALPGGFIYITRGMLGLLTSEAELASVLAHEVAHVTARHSVSQASRAQLAQLGVGLAGIFFPSVQELSPAIGAGLELLFLKHSRDDERQADEIGFSYVSTLGYDVNEFADVFAVLQRTGGDEEGGLPGWLSTHPTPEERVQSAEARAAAWGVRGRVDSEPYLRRIDGLVFGENPRHGFFEGNVFYHPDLRFEIRFPGGWQTRNLPQAVVGVSPDGTAAIELTIARMPDAEQAMQAFAQQKNVQVGRPRSSPVEPGRPPMLSADFIAVNQDGTRVRGIVSFAQHEGRVYQMVGYSAAEVFGKASVTISNSIESFRALSDANIAGIQPRRIDVVEITRPQTLAEFAMQYPSVVPLDQLALINHVPDPSSRLMAGTLVKRIVERS